MMTTINGNTDAGRYATAQLWPDWTTIGWRMKRWRYATNRDQPQKKSLRQNKTSSSDSCGTPAREPSIRTPIVSVEGIRDATVTWGGRNARRQPGLDLRALLPRFARNHRLQESADSLRRSRHGRRIPRRVQLFSTTLTIT